MALKASPCCEIRALCFSKLRILFPLASSHRVIALSSPAVANNLPSGLIITAFTLPGAVRRFCKLNCLSCRCQIMICLSSPPLIRRSPCGVKAISLTLLVPPASLECPCKRCNNSPVFTSNTTNVPCSPAAANNSPSGLTATAPNGNPAPR